MNTNLTKERHSMKKILLIFLMLNTIYAYIAAAEKNVTIGATFAGKTFEELVKISKTIEKDITFNEYEAFCTALNITYHQSMQQICDEHRQKNEYICTQYNYCEENRTAVIEQRGILNVHSMNALEAHMSDSEKQPAMIMNALLETNKKITTIMIDSEVALLAMLKKVKTSTSS